jgi:hypothetical protein
MTLDIFRLKSEIISSIDIRGYYESHLNAEKVRKFDSRGWSNKLLCPIHKDKKTPNFAFNINSGSFNCFACGKKGSIFDFWMILNGLDPKDTRNIVKAIQAFAELGKFDVKKWASERGSNTRKLTLDDSYKTRIQYEESGISQEDRVDELNEKIDQSVVHEFIRNLQPSIVSYLSKERGLNASTIKIEEIGYDPSWIYKPDPTVDSSRWCFGRITIPIRNIRDEIRNIRGYSSRAKRESKMANFIMNRGSENEKRFGSPPRLYNINKLVSGKYDHVVICEGEFDCIILNQEFRESDLFNWIAVTGTHGANTFSSSWVDYMKDKSIYICFDCDDEGLMAASSIATNYFLDGIKNSLFKCVKIIKLPLDGSKSNKDITDYFVKERFTIGDFITLCENSNHLITGGIMEDEASVEPIPVESLVDAIRDERYIDQRIVVPITISGATSRTYHAVKSYEVTSCPLSGTDSGCCHDEVGSQDIPYGHPLFIKCCMSSEDIVQKSIASKICKKKQKCSISPTRKVVMHEFFATQVVKRLTAVEVDGHLVNTQELVNVPVYILQPPGGFDIKPIDYLATGWIRTHPNTSLVSMFIEHMEPLDDEWNTFNSMQQSNIDILRNLRDSYTVDDIINQITDHVTRIYEADEILYLVLLTFLSPMEFYFNDEFTHGWLNTAIIGDSGTGKSATYVRLSDWIGVGDLFSALSGSRTGLLYAIRQRGGEWHINIGAYVRASGRIIAVDETQEMAAEEIKKMAIAMETGFLKIDRVASGGYQTQTRTIFLLNPKKFNGQAATISEFLWGAECLKNCFSPMFIRRLDLVVFTTGNNDIAFYNKISKPSSGFTLTPKMMKTLIFWAWTRKSSDIIWSEDSTKYCLDMAIELCKKFGFTDSVPLVNPQDFRFNLARLSTAYAVLSRSFSEDFQKLIIKEEHIETMAVLIDTIYSSDACDLHQMSNSCKSRNMLEDSFDSLSKLFISKIQIDSNSNNPKIRKTYPFIQLIVLLERVSSVNRRELCDQLSMNMSWVNEKISFLLAYYLIEQTRYGYSRTRRFNIFLKRWRKEPGISEMLDKVFMKIADNITIREMDKPKDIDIDNDSFTKDTANHLIERDMCDDVPDYIPVFTSDELID